MGRKLVFSVTNDLSYDQRMIRICSTLSRVGYQVTLVGRWRKNSKSLQPQNFQQHRLLCFFEKGILFYAEYQIRLFLYLMKNRFDGYGAIDLDTIIPQIVMARLRRKPCVYDAHEYFTESPEIERRPLIKWVWECVAFWCIPRVDAAYTVGPALANLLSKRYGVRFEVVRNVPIKLTDSCVTINSAQHILIYQGVLNEGRGLHQLIEIISDLPEVKLWLVGEGDCSEALRGLVKKLQLEDRIVFWGYQLPADLKDITTQATIGVNLLESRSLNYYYSLANKAFDYVQACLPAIHMDFPEYRALNEAYEVSVLTKDLTPDSLIASIQSLTGDEARYRRLVQACKAAKESWNWTNEASKLLALYQQIIPLE